jgi:FLVCR family MFS transporter 7
MNGMWFSAIAVDTANQFDLSYSQVNWLSNSINLVYLPTAFIVPWMVSNRFGVRKSVSRCQVCRFQRSKPLSLKCIIASVGLVIASWLRYAGTAKGLHPGGAYALLFIGQV